MWPEGSRGWRKGAQLLHSLRYAGPARRESVAALNSQPRPKRPRRVVLGPVNLNRYPSTSSDPPQGELEVHSCQGKDSTVERNSDNDNNSKNDSSSSSGGGGGGMNKNGHSSSSSHNDNDYYKRQPQ